ncbi:MAG TPA: lysophospholipid acyltransferase family protein [Anaerolineaceae bacterium]|nr:lysophospholipid acyltransferase family protein [Anaerolineaceae bacterium]
MERQRVMKLLSRLVSCLVDLKVVGGENIQDGIAYVVATSHISRLDTPFLMLSTHRQDIIAMVAREYEKAPFFGWFLNKLGVIWISRDGYDLGAFRDASVHLKRNWIVGIAPEGTRSKTKQLLQGKPGAALLAIRNQVPVIPTAVLGSTEVFQRILRLKKAHVEVRFGEPFLLPQVHDERTTKDRLQQASDEIMCHIALLLPEERRGFYANHPRLLELQAEYNAPQKTEIFPDGEQL